MQARQKKVVKIIRTRLPGAAFAVAAFLAVVAGPNAVLAEATRSPEEAALNAFGDPWSLAESNPSIPLIGASGCYRKPAEGMTYRFTPRELDFHRSLATPFVFEECAVILETDPPVVNNRPGGDTAGLRDRVKAFKQANPSQKYIGYFDFVKWESIPIGYREILENHPDWFVYKEGSSEDDLDDRLRHPKGGGHILDVTDPSYQDYISQQIADGLAYYGMDGVFADNIHSAPRLDPGDKSLLPADVRAKWADGEIAILKKIKERIGSEKYLFANVSRDEKEAFKKRVLAVVDGAMVEDGFSPVARPLDPRKGRLASTLRLYDLAEDAGKYVIVTANTFVDGSTYSDTSSAKERAYARYYLAAHLIFMKGKVFLLYHPPSASQAQYGAEAFFSDWNIKVGSPTGPYEEVAAGIFRRTFANAVVYLNSSESAYPIAPPAGFDLAPDGMPVTDHTLEPKTGFILSRPEAFQ